MLMEMLILISLCMKTCSPDRQGCIYIYSFGEEGMQLVQPSKFFSDTINFLEHVLARTRAKLGYVVIFSNAKKFRYLYSYYGPSSLKEYIHP